MGKTMEYMKDWLVNDVVYEKFSSRDGVNEKSYEASSNLSCYIEGRTSRVVNVRGEEVVSTERIYIDGDSSEITAGDISEDDRFTVDGVIRPVQAIGRFYDETGTLDYVVVYL